jgi:hypothetical protein
MPAIPYLETVCNRIIIVQLGSSLKIMIMLTKKT